MADQSSDRDPYLAEHVREALAQDPRVGELGLNVEIIGETVVLRGTLTSPERREAASHIARAISCRIMPSATRRLCPTAPRRRRSSTCL